MRPIKNNIIIEPIEYSQTYSGLYIKATETERLTGNVIAVGEGTRNNPMLIKVGDAVVYPHNIGREIDYQGKTYLLLRENQVIAIL